MRDSDAYTANPSADSIPKSKRQRESFSEPISKSKSFSVTKSKSVAKPISKSITYGNGKSRLVSKSCDDSDSDYASDDYDSFTPVSFLTR